MFERSSRWFTWSPLRISIGYLVMAIAGTWVVHFFLMTASDPQHRRLEVVADGAYAFVTAALLYLGLVLLRRRSEMDAAERRASETRFLTLVESMDDFVFTIDDQKRFVGTHGGQQVAPIVRPDRMIGRTTGDLMQERFSEVHERAFDRALAGEAVEYEWTIPGADGLRWFHTLLSPVEEITATGERVVGVARDVTDQKRKELELERYRLLADTTRDLALFVADDGRIIEANKAAAAAYGLTRDELIGSEVTGICDGEDSKRCLTPMFEGTSETVITETLHKRADGSIFPVEVSASVTEKDGERLVIALARDITERKRRESYEKLLHEIDRRILQNHPIDRILHFISEQVAARYGFPLVQVSLKGEAGAVDVRECAGVESEFLRQISVRWDDTPRGRGPTGTAIRTGEVQVCNLLEDPDFSPWRSRAIEHGFSVACAVPFAVAEEVVGAITLFAKDNVFNPNLIRTLTTLADQVALSVVLARDHEQIQLQTVALESAANAVVVTDPDGVIRWVNPAFTKLSGYSSDEVIGESTRILKSGNHSEAFYKQMWETLVAGDVWQGELYNRRRDGSLYIEEQTITPVRGARGEITHFVAIKQDISDRKHQEEQIRYLAMHDPLTNLPNRRALQSKMDRVVRKRHPSALLMIDLDNFKPANDTLGHAAGDHYLGELANLLRETLRPEDFLARLGGDEFAVILEDTPVEGAGQIAERLREVVAQHTFSWNERVFGFSLSIGVCPITPQSDPGAVMVRADSALYAAKEQGKNRVVVYACIDDSGVKGVEDSRWAAHVRRALREDLLVVYYQPVVRLDDGRTEHFEALIRMKGDDGRICMPDDFLSAAHRFGLLPEIDEWVVRHVIKDLSECPTLNAFVNLSGATLNRVERLDTIVGMVREAKIRPGRLAFEITESVAISDFVAAEKWIRALKDLGCRFALDDFGVGFSSLAYLRNLAVDYVKIDRSFVRDVDSNPVSRALIQAVHTVARTLGKEVIAEGIESEEHAKAIQQLGIGHGQGFHWARPRAYVLNKACVGDARGGSLECEMHAMSVGESIPPCEVLGR